MVYVTPLSTQIMNANMICPSKHTSINTPSKCTARTIRAYFQDGTLPAPGTVCDADLVPFEKWNLTSVLGTMPKTDDEVAVDDYELDVALFNLMLGSSK